MNEQPSSQFDRVYSSINRAVFDRIPVSAGTILDIGCGDGTLGEALKRRAPCVVTGVTASEAETARARTVLDKAVVANLDHDDLSSLGQFDVIVCSHVLEHLRDPGKTLAGLRANLAPGGLLIVALPNPLLWRQRLEFMAGRFRYTQGGGIMDDTHLRFFDWTTARQLVEGAGFTVREAFADGGWPGSRFLPGVLGGAVDGLARSVFPGFVGVQFVLTAASTS
jgi:SAM-dependent methyltransferase